MKLHNYLRAQQPLPFRKSLLKRLHEKHAEFGNPYRLRVKTFLSLLLLPVSFLRRARRTMATELVIEFYRVSANGESDRIDCVTHYAPSTPREALIVANHKHMYYRPGGGWQPWAKAIGIWLRYTASALGELIAPARYPNFYMYYVAVNAIHIALLRPQRIYLFNPYDAGAYLTAWQHQSSHELHVILGNSALYGHCRYTHLPDAHFILCNPCQYEEIAAFRRMGWLAYRTLTLWGPEEALQHAHIQHPPQTVDIGIYSRGDWARRGLYRERDVEQVRAYARVDNPAYQTFLEVLDFAIALRQRYGVSVKIYTHPLERDWYNQEGIDPPYSAKAQAHGIQVDLSPGNSVDKFHEARIGLGIMSTSLLDRWYHGLESWIYYTAVDRYFYKPQFMGRYASRFFETEAELMALMAAERSESPAKE